MKTFQINEYLEIVCDWKKTRNGFKHEATLLLNGIERETVKVCYLNRTWEAYEYQSVIHKLLEKSKLLSKDEQELIKDKLDGKDGYDGEGNKQAMSALGSIGMVAALGNVFGKTIEEKNRWKKRMLDAGLKGKGLNFPEDWDSLSEEDKQARLDGAINQII